MADQDGDWWPPSKLAAFLLSLSPIQESRVESYQKLDELAYFGAFRRTRNGSAVWEVRADEKAGALRTTRGGSAKQAILRAGQGGLAVRWMSPMEYARLQGAEHLSYGAVSPVQAMFALGDAVCVPVVEWLAKKLSASHNAPMNVGETPEVTALYRGVERILNTLDNEGRKVGDSAGVYLFYDYDAEPIYVGQTYETLRSRIGRHLTGQRTDAVAKSVLDPFEVAEIELWPFWTLIRMSRNHLMRKTSKTLPRSTRKNLIGPNIPSMRKHSGIRNTESF